MDIKDIQKQMEQIMNEQNNRSISEFEGCSPAEMHDLLHFSFEPQSPISIQKLTKEEYLNIPILNQIKYFLNLVGESGEIKLTAKGFLPTKIVHSIYNQGFIKENQFTSGISKLNRESDSLTVNLTRLLVETAGLTKKRKGKLSLTKTGEKIRLNSPKLFDAIFKTMTQKFNWAYYDYYEDEQLGQLGYGFTLLLISKYGKQKRLNSFYANKYHKAFPQFLQTLTPTYGTVEDYANNCYSIRTFDRFLSYFGLVEIAKEGKGFDEKTFITKTKLFDKLIKVRPHSKR